MLTSEGLGIHLPTTGTVAAAVTETASFTDRPSPAPLVPGSITAQALFQVWSGQPVTIVKSPPGAGKTLLVATVIAHLRERSEMSLIAATLTRRQAVDLAGTVAAQTGPGHVYLKIKDLDPSLVPDGVQQQQTTSQTPGHSVVIRTLASCAQSAPSCDVMIVDEAYQATFAQVAAAANSAKQILLVGDPGQIGPVITCDTSIWENRPVAPHHPAPKVFARREDAIVLQLDATWRLGPQTAKAIAPLYDFNFTSSRPARRIDGMEEIESIKVPSVDDPFDFGVMRTIADRAASMVGRTLVVGEGTDHETRLPLEAGDVAVVVSRNAQATTIGAMLRAQGLTDIAVGTADRLQGGQWHAVVALDPLCGMDGTSDHSLSLGRLCVMASRASTHLTWVYNDQWSKLLEDESISAKAGKQSVAVRKALCS